VSFRVQSQLSHNSENASTLWPAKTNLSLKFSSSPTNSGSWAHYMLRSVWTVSPVLGRISTVYDFPRVTTNPRWNPNQLIESKGWNDFAILKRTKIWIFIGITKVTAKKKQQQNNKTESSNGLWLTQALPETANITREFTWGQIAYKILRKPHQSFVLGDQ
jgi:hypothetical protein